MPVRKSPLARAGCALAAAGAAWQMAPSFVGIRGARPSPATAMKGYRLDWMLEGRGGDSSLQTQDGYWVGEVGFETSQNAQGYRYRMRPTKEEYQQGREVDGYMQQIGPFKFKFGEIFGGTGNNEALRALKRKIVLEGLTDPKKIEENDYWMKRYGHKRFEPYYVDQSTGQAKSLFPTMAQWSGLDPLNEERGTKWIEADWGKPWIQKYIGTKIAGYVTAEQVQYEYNTGKVKPDTLKKPTLPGPDVPKLKIGGKKPAAQVKSSGGGGGLGGLFR